MASDIEIDTTFYLRWKFARIFLRNHEVTSIKFYWHEAKPPRIDVDWSGTGIVDVLRKEVIP